MAVLEDLSLVTGGDLVPFPDVLKIASLIGLDAFLVMKRKERTQLPENSDFWFRQFQQSGLQHLKR